MEISNFRGVFGKSLEARLVVGFLLYCGLSYFFLPLHVNSLFILLLTVTMETLAYESLVTEGGKAHDKRIWTGLLLFFALGVLFYRYERMSYLFSFLNGAFFSIVILLYFKAVCKTGMAGFARWSYVAGITSGLLVFLLYYLLGLPFPSSFIHLPQDTISLIPVLMRYVACRRHPALRLLPSFAIGGRWEDGAFLLGLLRYLRRLSITGRVLHRSFVFWLWQEVVQEIFMTLPRSGGIDL